MTREEKPNETPRKEKMQEALAHYDEIATKACWHRSDIPEAIRAYYAPLPPAEGAEQAGSEREYPYCPTCGDTIDHGEDYGGYCCTKCRDGHNNDLTARPLNREMKRPNLELEYRFSRNRGCYIHPLTGRSYEDDLEAYINYLTALIRDELIAYDKWCATNYKQPCVNTADRNVDEYLKSRER